MVVVLWSRMFSGCILCGIGGLIFICLMIYVSDCLLWLDSLLFVL